MPSSEFSNIDFGFEYGTLSEINRASLSNGTFYIDIENGNLLVDINSTRISLNDIIFGYTEAEIRSMPIPSNKVYFAKDTYNILFFDFTEIAWKKVGGEQSTYAQKDELGNTIHEYYAVKNTVNDQIDALDQKVESINRFDVKFYDSVENLPEIGTKFIIYFVPSTSDNEDESDLTKNVCVEYIWIETGENEGHYEQIGLAAVDLSNYYTKEASDNKFETKTEVNSKVSTITNSVSILSEDLNTYKSYVSSTYMTKESAAEDTGNVSAALNLYKTEVADTYATKAGLSDSVATINENLNDYAKTSQSIKSVTISGNDLVATTVSGTVVKTDISDAIKNMLGISTETINGVKYDVIDYGEE